MSFVYAEKRSAELNKFGVETLCIFSDTKISLEGASKQNWGPKTSAVIKRYGMIKSIIVSPQCCVSFAGNNIDYANELINKLAERKSIPEEEFCEIAYRIHKKAHEDDIEFIICYADDKNETHITCIKEGNMWMDCQKAWIGSPVAYRQLIRLSEEPRFALSSKFDLSSVFREVVEQCEDDAVGGFSIRVRYDKENEMFVYPERLELGLEKAQIVEPGEVVKFSGGVAEGVYSAYYHQSESEVLIEFQDADRALLYNRKYRLDDLDQYPMMRSHFLLPIMCEYSTGKMIEIV